MKTQTIQLFKTPSLSWRGLFNLVKLPSKEVVREKDVTAVKDTIFDLIINNALDFDHMEQVEILKDVLSRFKEAKRERSMQLTNEGQTIHEAVKELTQHY